MLKVYEPRRDVQKRKAACAPLFGRRLGLPTVLPLTVAPHASGGSGGSGGGLAARIGGGGRLSAQPFCPCLVRLCTKAPPHAAWVGCWAAIRRMAG